MGSLLLKQTDLAPRRMRHDDYRALPRRRSQPADDPPGPPPDWANREGGDYDLVVLGGGPGGLTAAMTAAAGDFRVAMTEQRLTGGTCVNFG